MVRRSGRTAPRRNEVSGGDGVAAVYAEMLSEAADSSASQVDVDGRVPKRRRTRKPGERDRPKEIHESPGKPSSTAEADRVHPDAPSDASKASGPTALVQSAYADSESSSESMVDWEEVDIEGPEDDRPKATSADEHAGESDDLVLDLAKPEEGERVKKPQRRAITASERRLRLEIHKMHLLCFLAYLDTRNNWCNDFEVQEILKPTLTETTVSYLNPVRSLSQFQQSRSFMDGLEQASQAWRARFKKTARGLRRSFWAGSAEELRKLRPPEDIEGPLERTDFRRLAKKPATSRDVGSQLFCALLRSAGVDARLVCSLQPLPFTAAGLRNSIPQGLNPELVFDAAGRQEGSHTDERVATRDQPTTPTSDHIKSSASTRIRRLGQPAFDNSTVVDAGKAPSTPAQKPKRIRESRYPVFWVEAFNKALQKWIPVDPLVTETINKPAKLEPSAGEPENNMSYVVAFEDDGVARDVTIRYSKAFNAKTRKLRVESTKGGQKWWRNALRTYSRGWDLDRDQVEDAEFASKVGQEPMPRNVQDFKDHPYYALERHLKRSEVIHPRHEVGKVAAGKSGVKSLEPIFRRRNVCIVKTADSWYRLGREIKPGEQPIKHRKPRARDDESQSDDETAASGLYAEFQTTIYRAPRVVNGRIPKNSYGNLDLFVPSMVPEGGKHFADLEASYAAKLLGIDYADAVTGFEFKGRHGTAVIRGIVAASEFGEAMESVIHGIWNERARAESLQRSLENLRLWKHLLVSLRIKKRIQGYDVEGEERKVDGEALSPKVEEDTGMDEGGFIPEEGPGSMAEPTVGQFHANQSVDDREQSPRYSNPPPDPIADQPREDDYGGGFLPDADDDTGGGFMPDEEEERPDSGEDVYSAQDSRYDNYDEAGGSFMLENEGEQLPEKAMSRSPPQKSSHNTSDEDIEMQEFLLQHARPASMRGPASSKSADGMEDVSPKSASKSTHDSEVEPSAPMEDVTAPIEPEAPPTSSHNSLGGSESSEKSPVDQGLDNINFGHQDEEKTEDSNDQISLLSHDPEDEDAEPEWLAD
ncbi:MAG: hypothetical protein M4579_002230 [Chaenotheca gracillima]|nr:MAG: hypothetical protein M4579_002230 [Chaenotheca gracillima]